MMYIRCGRSRSASENCNIVAVNRVNFWKDIIETSIFLQKFQLVIVGAGQIFMWISNDGFIFRENFKIEAIWW